MQLPSIALMLAVQVSTVISMAGAEKQPLEAEDQRVLNTVLNDLLTYREKDSPILTEHDSPTNLLFVPAAVTWPLTMEQVLYRQDATSWHQLDGEYAQPIREAASNLVSRVGRADSFRKFHPSDKRVQLFDDDSNLGLLDRRPIRAWLPGYSLNGSIVLVRLTIPWSIHVAEGTYVLRRGDGKWTILLRQFVFRC